jgi:hypothetical protein
MADLTKWPTWEIQFDRNGQVDPAARATLLTEIHGAGLTDLVVMSHGWNSSPDHSRRLYQQWFGMLGTLIPDGSPAQIGTLGVIWPSMLWPDESQPGSGGGAAALGGPGGGDNAAPVTALEAVYPDPGQQQILDQLAGLLDEQSPDPAKLNQFHALMRQLADTEPAPGQDPDSQLKMLEDEPRELAERFATALDDASQPGAGLPPDQGGVADLGGGGGLPGAGADGQGAAAGLGSLTGQLWNGMKEALRQLTYFQMKQRAGTVGRQGLGPFLGDLASRSAGLRVHLIGHSFGGRLVSFTLAGLPAGRPSPVASLTLLEGAFSHYAFAASLPQDPNRSGALKGMAARVSGPLLACFSTFDLALAIFYPLASFTSGEDAAGLTEDLKLQFGGMGHDGAQAMQAPTVKVKNVGQAYQFAAGKFTNIDCSSVVKKGDPPSGAHSDIVHKELGWAMLTAAGLV